MNKKFLAVAVAGAFGIAPLAAFAQSSVTISGVFKGGLEGVHLGSQSAGRAGSGSSVGIADDSSQIHFNVLEDLGGGLQADAQLDIRFKIDDPQTGGAQSNFVSTNGNTHVGLKSKQWGRIFFGRQDLHYFNRESDLTSRASLRADSISILAYANAGASAIASASRTNDVIWYQTPNWNGFTMIAAYTTSPGSPNSFDNDLSSTIRKGSGWNLNPNLAGKNYQVGYSYWNAKPDATPTYALSAASGTSAPTPTAAAINQRGDRLYGSYSWNGLKVGLAWDRSKLTNAVGGVQVSDRTAWSIPIGYQWGPHNIFFHYDRANNDKAPGYAGMDTKATMVALAYAYDLSKRTSLALAYARINNGAAAKYDFFTDASLGVTNGAVMAGEDPRLWALTIRHAF